MTHRAHDKGGLTLSNDVLLRVLANDCSRSEEVEVARATRNRGFSSHSPVHAIDIGERSLHVYSYCEAMLWVDI